MGNGEVISENDGYGEYLNDRKKEYTPQNLYVIIWYKVNDEVKTEILNEMMPFLTTEYGNASSLYSIGRKSKRRSLAMIPPLRSLL